MASNGSVDGLAGRGGMDAVMYVRYFSRTLKARFKAACGHAGKSQSAVLIRFMKDFAERSANLEVDAYDRAAEDQGVRAENVKNRSELHARRVAAQTRKERKRLLRYATDYANELVRKKVAAKIRDFRKTGRWGEEDGSDVEPKSIKMREFEAYADKRDRDAKREEE